MPRKGYFLGSLVFALAAFLAVLGLGSALSSSHSEKAPAPAPEVASGKRVARSDDNRFLLTLISPDSPYLFGPSRIEVKVELPGGDRIQTIDFFVDGRLVSTRSEAPFAVEFDFGEAIRAHSIRVVGTTVQDRLARLSYISRWATPPSRVEVNLVSLPVAVVDPEGRFVEGLQLSDFTLLEDGKPQTLVHFDEDPTPVSMVVALDASGSMENSLWSAQKASQDFIQALPSFYEISVLGFSESVVLARDFTYDRRQLAHALKTLEPKGKTGLYDTLREMVARLRGREDRRIGVLFTDGGETVYEDDPMALAKLEEALELARESGVLFYTIGFGRDSALDVLCRIAETTGGQCYDSADPRALPKIYARMGDELAHQYTLSYYPNRPFDEGGWRKVEVSVEDPDLRVRARPGYLAKSKKAPEPVTEPPDRSLTPTAPEGPKPPAAAGGEDALTNPERRGSNPEAGAPGPDQELDEADHEAGEPKGGPGEEAPASESQEAGEDDDSDSGDSGKDEEPET